ncbi:MAG: TAXI family TRAP transporter solute-binding subunit [Candidatus Zophobacter franzmannii]|nr:TAXI family TRAP transporter solute-binding subunit [Candidatus Zophobacter franzmannii]
MRNRLNIVWGVILCLGLIVAGCSKKTDPDSQSPPSKRQFLSLGTAPPGGAFFVVGSAIAEVVQAHTEESSWQITAEATKGTQENIHRLDKSEIDFALANASITFFAVRGEGKWEKPYPIQSVMTLAPNIALFITPAKSGIQSMADLRGKRVVVGPAGAGFEHFVEPILKAHGLSYKDIQPLNDTQAGAVALLADGSADAAFLGGVLPTASITQACASQDIHFIPFDEAAKDNLTANYLFFAKKTIPANTYKGQSEAFEGLNVGNMILVTSASVSSDTVYQFTKTLYEHAEDVVEKHPAGRAINPANAVRDTGTDFHPGAIRYFKEIGIWKKD